MLDFAQVTIKQIRLQHLLFEQGPHLSIRQGGDVAPPFCNTYANTVISD